VLDQVNRHAPPGAGCRILVVAAAAEPLAEILSGLGARVHRRGPAAPFAAFRVPSRLASVPAIAAASYDAVVLTPGVTFPHGGLDGGGATLSAAAAALVPGGLLALAEEGDMGPPRGDRFSAALPFSDAFIAALARLGLSPLAMAPCATTAMTLDHAVAEEAATTLPRFVTVRDGTPWLTGAWFFVKTGADQGAATLDEDLRRAAAVLASSPS